MGTRQRVLLLKNEREEWELPGGRLEPSIYQPLLKTLPDRRVVIVTYGCAVLSCLLPPGAGAVDVALLMQEEAEAPHGGGVAGIGRRDAGEWKPAGCGEQ